jgi:P27 family predicted phage terminase small subunit
MAGQRQPIELIIANGKKHLTEEEIEERRRSEPKVCTDGIEAPSFLTAAQKKQFNKIAGQLQKIKIMGETDVDALARYITAQSLYEAAVKELRKLAKDRPEKDSENYYKDLELWYALNDITDKRQDRYVTQAQMAARDLGLTISSRCKLQVPVKEEAPKENKFSKFTKVVG